MKYKNGENIMNIVIKKISGTEKRSSVRGLEPGVQRHNHSAPFVMNF